MADRVIRPRRATVLQAMSYGPVGYLQAAIVGFILATAVFVAVDASLKEHNVVLELPILLVAASTGAGAGVAVGAVANFLIGRRIRDERELQKKIFGGRELPPPVPRPDVPGIELAPSKRNPSPQVRTDRAA